MSPRDFAAATGVGLSHMTVYRWLDKKDTFELPKKYHLALDRFSASQSGSAETPWYQDQSVLERLSSVKNANAPGARELIDLLENDGKDYEDPAKLKEELEVKLQDKGVTRKIHVQVQTLLKSLFSAQVPRRSKFVIVGALLYFLSPIDLIPDTIPVLGYVDDLAVLTLAVDFVMRNRASQLNHATR
jgi:uncharacterized membrane protein YkvA (DUF1232 family)